MPRALLLLLLLAGPAAANGGGLFAGHLPSTDTWRGHRFFAFSQTSGSQEIGGRTYEEYYLVASSELWDHEAAFSSMTAFGLPSGRRSTREDLEVVRAPQGEESLEAGWIVFKDTTTEGELLLVALPAGPGAVPLAAPAAAEFDARAELPFLADAEEEVEFLKVGGTYVQCFGGLDFDADGRPELAACSESEDYTHVFVLGRTAEGWRRLYTLQPL